MRKIIFTVFEYVILGFTLMCVIGLFLLGRDWFTATFALQWGVKREVIVLIFLAGGGVVGLFVGVVQYWKNRTTDLAIRICNYYRKDDICGECPMLKETDKCTEWKDLHPLMVRKMYKEMIDQEEKL